MNTLKTIAWGLFCATSWTWCIGMFLPLLMIDRFGWPGFIAFAVPNVIGCAAFGYVVRTRRRSAAILARHRTAMTWFSIITVGYHLFFIIFIIWIMRMMETFDRGWPLLIIMAVATLFIAMGSRRTDASFLLGIVACYGLSIGVFVHLGIGPLTVIPWSGSMPSHTLLWIAPVLTFGFLLCPYFDLTFHRALRASPSRHAFLVFGVAFSLMILLTCAYWSDWSRIAGIVAFHILAQTAVTVGLHLGEGWRTHRLGDSRGLTAVAFVFAASIVIGIVLHLFSDPSDSRWFESMYVRFLVFYGLVFPAYAVVFMHPTNPAELTRRHLLYFAVAMVAALPFYELGFIHGYPWMLAFPMVAVVVWLIIRMRGGRAVINDGAGSVDH